MNNFEKSFWGRFWRNVLGRVYFFGVLEKIWDVRGGVENSFENSIVGQSAKDTPNSKSQVGPQEIDSNLDKMFETIFPQHLKIEAL
jgi:hypothetical protein